RIDVRAEGGAKLGQHLPGKARFPARGEVEETGRTEPRPIFHLGCTDARADRGVNAVPRTEIDKRIHHSAKGPTASGGGKTGGQRTPLIGVQRRPRDGGSVKRRPFIAEFAFDAEHSEIVTEDG